MLTTRLLTKYLAWRNKAQKQNVAEAKAGASQSEALLKAKPRLLDEKPNQDEEDYFEPLNFEQAQQVIQGLRKTASLLSPWRLIQWQLLVAAFATFVAYIGFDDKLIAWSVVYGGMSVVLPASVFAWGLKRSEGAKSPLLASAGFFVWEAVKVVLTVALLFAAPALIVNLNWLALLAGFVVTMKVYWIALWLYPVRKNSFNN
jgi:ATP synthase protein I